MNLRVEYVVVASKIAWAARFITQFSISTKGLVYFKIFGYTEVKFIKAPFLNFRSCFPFEVPPSALKISGGYKPYSVCICLSLIWANISLFSSFEILFINKQPETSAIFPINGIRFTESFARWLGIYLNICAIVSIQLKWFATTTVAFLKEHFQSGPKYLE